MTHECCCGDGSVVTACENLAGPQGCWPTEQDAIDNAGVVGDYITLTGSATAEIKVEYAICHPNEDPPTWGWIAELHVTIPSGTVGGFETVLSITSSRGGQAFMDFREHLCGGVGFSSLRCVEMWSRIGATRWVAFQTDPGLYHVEVQPAAPADAMCYRSLSILGNQMTGCHSSCTDDLPVESPISTSTCRYWTSFEGVYAARGGAVDGGVGKWSVNFTEPECDLTFVTTMYDFYSDDSGHTADNCSSCVDVLDCPERSIVFGDKQYYPESWAVSVAIEKGSLFEGGDDCKGVSPSGPPFDPDGWIDPPTSGNLDFPVTIGEITDVLLTSDARSLSGIRIQAQLHCNNSPLCGDPGSDEFWVVIRADAYFSYRPSFSSGLGRKSTSYVISVGIEDPWAPIAASFPAPPAWDLGECFLYGSFGVPPGCTPTNPPVSDRCGYAMPNWNGLCGNQGYGFRDAPYVVRIVSLTLTPQCGNRSS